MNTFLALKHLFPAAISGSDFNLRDYGDGVVRIENWNTALGPTPTEAELIAASAIAERNDSILRKLAAIDAEAGRARGRYITIAPGQEATYLLKAAQAEAFRASGYTGTVPGLVQAEIDATGAMPAAATDAILAQQVAWEAKAAQIESARRRGKVAVGNAADVEAIEIAETAAITELAAL